MSIFTTIIANAILVSSMIYVVSILLNKKVELKNYKTYISFISIMLISILSYYYINSYIKVILIVFSFTLMILYLFNKNLKISIITSIFYELLIVISESLFVLIISLIYGMNSEGIMQTQFGTIFANFSIALFSILISMSKPAKKIFKFIINAIDKLNERLLIILSFLVIVVVNFLSAALYYNIDFSYLLIFNALFIIFNFIIIFYSFKTNNNYNKVYDKYNTTLNSLKEYENILDRYRVSNHENKNQMLTIRNMISKNNKKTINYIDAIVENKLKDNDRIMLETTKIPAGGLRGLIYSKLLLMDNLNIEYELEISNEIRTVDLINNIDDFTMLDICKVIGVYLDNSIQAVENLKEKYINIEMYLQNKDLIIAISNNYEGVIELDKLEQKGYTSKGTGHGYGLSLTKEIINNNKKLSNEKQISKDSFTQVLKIKM